MSTDLPGGDSDFDGVSDPSDFKQQRRIKAILDARERVVEQHRKVMDLQASGQINEFLARRMLRQAAKEYALESEQIIRAHLPSASNPEEWSAEEEAAYHTWNEVELGVLEMLTRSMEFTGLKDFLDAPRRIQESWVESGDDPVDGTNTERRSETYEIPLEVSERVYRALNYFWYELGLDVELDQKLPHDKI